MQHETDLWVNLVDLGNMILLLFPEAQLVDARSIRRVLQKNAPYTAYRIFVRMLRELQTLPAYT